MKNKLMVVGSLVLATVFTIYRAKAQNAALGTLTGANTYAIANITGAGTGILTWLATPSGANLATALTSALSNTKGGTGGDSSAQTGVARLASGTWSYSELSGDCATSGSNAVVCTQINGANYTVNSSGLNTKNDGITTTGLGVPIIGWQSAISNSSAVSLVTLATAPGAGDYEIVFNLDLHTACTTGTGALTVAFAWTGNAARTITTGSWSLPSTQGASVPFSGILPIHVVSGNVTFTPTEGTACSTGTATWDGLIQLRRVN